MHLALCPWQTLESSQQLTVIFSNHLRIRYVQGGNSYQPVARTRRQHRNGHSAAGELQYPCSDIATLRYSTDSVTRLSIEDLKLKSQIPPLYGTIACTRVAPV